MGGKKRTEKAAETGAEDKIAEALQEALLMMEAPPYSPRLWPVSRGNLTKLLGVAIKLRRAETEALEEWQERKNRRNPCSD